MSLDNSSNPKTPKETHAACPRGLVAQAPTPSFTPRKFCEANTASSPFVNARIRSPRRDNLLSWFRSCVVRGSENDDDGGDRNGGGNAREGRLAWSAKPVSKINGDFDTILSLEPADPPSCCLLLWLLSLYGSEPGVATP